MIAIDTSVLAAIALEEPDGPTFINALDEAEGLVIGAPTLLELHMVLVGRFGTQGAPLVAQRVIPFRALTIPFDQDHAIAAQVAFATYGKGRGHPAQLNFGDCMAYAVAKVAGCPLLYKGDDFAATDIVSALAR